MLLKSFLKAEGQIALPTLSISHPLTHFIPFFQVYSSLYPLSPAGLCNHLPKRDFSVCVFCTLLLVVKLFLSSSLSPSMKETWWENTLRKCLSYFLSNQTLGEGLRGLQGLPGKAGPQGLKGEVGPQGEKGQKGERGSK